jgi:hypothetical protein
VSDPGRDDVPLDEEEVTAELLESLRTTRPPLAWLRVLATLRLARIVHAAVRLGIVDELHTEPKASQEVATATGTDDVAVHRLLRALYAAGIVVESEDARFSLTKAGRSLAIGSRPSVGEALLDFFDPALVPLDGLVRTIQTGRPAFEEHHGVEFYDYLARHPESGAEFDRSMNRGTELRANALLSAADFAQTHTVVDIGGGDGGLMMRLLGAHDHLAGIVFERTETAARARARIAHRNLTDRCMVVDGDFFASPPPPGDVYILSFVLHNWNDDRAMKILSLCRRAMGERGVLFIVEQLRAPAGQASIVDYLSLPGVELLGGRERTETEFGVLLDTVGLQLVGVAATPPNPFSVLEARGG